ncbi:response regulator [Pseudomonas sp. P1B16]|jgi:DNA-binding NtrC family response regulator|uniref:response regulator n=1 Tax=Pseudomonas TaxID=286 RepID=UPI001645F95F|nr:MULTISPECIES: response regulator [unclassified Pseudomonas]MBC3480260.1 response regulator [Pseudomonas sp. SWRI77]UVL02043.1 response regulator [Pseudomonas sp. B21-047]WPM28977.1 response regulator [Pseudomonas sp. P1B16]
MKLDMDRPSLSGMTVVVVEDDETLRTVLVAILAEMGATCVAFGNAEDALIRLLESKGACSLMIVDHGVPGCIKGMEFISMVHEKWPGLPAILTSGFQLDTSTVAPPFSYLFKPWSIDELVATIGRTLASATYVHSAD